MIQVRELDDSEKKKFKGMDFVVFFGGNYQYFTKAALKELTNKCSDILLETIS